MKKAVVNAGKLHKVGRAMVVGCTALLLGSPSAMARFDTARGIYETEQLTLKSAVDNGLQVVHFSEAKSELTDLEKAGLRAMINGVRDHSVITKVTVASWSDNIAPLAQGDNLAAADVDLARGRIKAVGAALTELGVRPILEHNMAEAPSGIADAFKTHDSNIKHALSGEAVADEDDAFLAHQLLINGGPGKAVVIVHRSER